jgi:hypothetical protein
MTEPIRPFDIGEPRVTPADLKPGHVYETPMGGFGPVLIVSVGRKWITFRERQRGRRADYHWSPKRRLLRSGWEGPFFHGIGDDHD